MINKPRADFILSGQGQNFARIVDKEAHDLIVTDTGFAHVMRELAEHLPIAPGLEVALVASYSSMRIRARSRIQPLIDVPQVELL